MPAPEIDYSRRLGRHLKAARLAAGLTPTQACEATGKCRGLLYAWEKGSRTLKADDLPALADAYGVPVERLVPPWTESGPTE